MQHEWKVWGLIDLWSGDSDGSGRYGNCFEEYWLLKERVCGFEETGAWKQGKKEVSKYFP